MSSSKSTSRASIPEAREALDQFKYEVAQELNIPLKRGYNGDLTSAPVSYTHLSFYHYSLKNTTLCKIKSGS